MGVEFLGPNIIFYYLFIIKDLLTLLFNVYL